jgi:hypothetical protein
MVANENEESTRDRHPLDILVKDPTGLPPMCDEETFGQVLQLMANGMAPRLFAIVHEYGERVDAQCAAWGMAFDDHADVVGVGDAIHKGVPSAEHAVRFFRFGSHITPHLVWVTPEQPE